SHSTVLFAYYALKYHDNFRILSKDPAASPSKSYRVAFKAKIGAKKFSWFRHLLPSIGRFWHFGCRSASRASGHGFP
ncbi:MAG TPA: hypothetical protein VK554_11695, partial [Bradyrhizobium sp.]|nr:hypothetical protein [Bradyrhizobium sp.]